MADPWQEVTAGDMQRQAENGYMFRRSMTKEFGYLCTPIGYTGTLEEDTQMECYAHSVDRIDWYCPSMTIGEFDKLEAADVGVNPEVDEREGVDHPVAVADAANEPHVGEDTWEEQHQEDRRD